jgi:hypothetical protein
MLFRETVAVYCENHTEHINTLCAQNAEILNFKACSTHCTLKRPTWQQCRVDREVLVSNLGRDTSCPVSAYFTFFLSTSGKIQGLACGLGYSCVLPNLYNSPFINDPIAGRRVCLEMNFGVDFNETLRTEGGAEGPAWQAPEFLILLTIKGPASKSWRGAIWRWVSWRVETPSHAPTPPPNTFWRGSRA